MLVEDFSVAKEDLKKSMTVRMFPPPTTCTLRYSTCPVGYCRQNKINLALVPACNGLLSWQAWAVGRYLCVQGKKAFYDVHQHRTILHGRASFAITYEELIVPT